MTRVSRLPEARLQSLYAIVDFHHFEPASFGDAAFRAFGATRLANLKDPDKTVSQLLGDGTTVRRFARFVLGESA